MRLRFARFEGTLQFAFSTPPLRHHASPRVGGGAALQAPQLDILAMLPYHSRVMPSDTPTFSQWHARPVFISSTFKDMQAERDYLRSHVFPRLEEKLRERRHQLEPIDLRLGVETTELGTEEARELLVLKVCLEEIQRSRPFLIGILGDRYGWVPPQERMETATQEADFDTEVKGKSVTALEIEFGVLRDHPDQRQRSFFYFREPLPYDRMPTEIAVQYSDACSSDAAVRAGHDRLTALKQQLITDPELRPHVHSYHATWDEKAQHVTGLEAWGDRVFEHLWAALDEETRDFASQQPVTWEQRERAALTEFIAQRSRDFTGREALITQLVDIATSPFHATDPLNAVALNHGVTWAACVTGSPGSGKSALMAEVYQRLAKDSSILILANAAGATPRGAEPDAVLRRFIGELAAALGLTSDPLPENAGPDDVDAAFASLLARAALQTRVVVLLDALDQFEATPRGQHLTWLRARQWPGNARLIATGITGTTPVEALIKNEGVEELELFSLDADDVTEIARRVWARYHRQVNYEVLRVLSEKKLPDGTPAAGNPLWLTLVLEQLNLLDADDFARAEREFTGGPAERLRALLVDTAKRMPPDVPALYGWFLNQTEKTFGTPHARAFAVLIALGRFGWRETDLIPLIPTVAALLFPSSHPSSLILHPFTDLNLATIRRGFRAHLVRHGAAGQLDFFHAQMRQAVRARALEDARLEESIHRAIADHLEAQPESDPLRETEMMVHLIGSGDKARAAQVLADLPSPSNALTGATQALVRHLLTDAHKNPNQCLAWVATFPAQPNLTRAQVANIANRFLFDLSNALVNAGRLGSRRGILHAARWAFARLVDSDPCDADWQYCALFLDGTMIPTFGSDPSNRDWQYHLCISNERLGDVLLAMGHLGEARQAYDRCHDIISQLAAGDPSNVLWQRGLSESHEKRGDLLSVRGNVAGAMSAYREALVARQRLATIDPSNAVWQSDLGKSHENMGDLLGAQGNFDGALLSYHEALEVRERLAAADPSNVVWQCDLGRSLEKLGEMLGSQGDLAGALLACREALEVRQRLAATDPSNAVWQRDLSGSQEKLAEVLRAQGDLAGALLACREALAVRERMAAADPSSAVLQRDLSGSQSMLGDTFFAMHQARDAIKFYAVSFAVRLKLLSQSRNNMVLRQDSVQTGLRLVLAVGTFWPIRLLLIVGSAAEILMRTHPIRFVSLGLAIVYMLASFHLAYSFRTRSAFQPIGLSTFWPRPVRLMRTGCKI